MTVVRVHEDETFEAALRKFRHKCKKAGIFTEVRKRSYHENPSAKKRRKILSAKRQTMRKTVD